LNILVHGALELSLVKLRYPPQKLLKELNLDSPRLLCALSGLSQVALLDPLLFNTEHKRIVVDFVVKNLLMRATVSLLCCLVTKGRSEDVDHDHLLNRCVDVPFFFCF
jgi:hypothetical protein